MVILHVHIQVKPDRLEEFLVEGKAHAGGSSQEPGCVHFELLQQVDDPTRWMLIEVFKTEEDMRIHHDTPHFARWAKNVPDLIIEPRIRTYYHNRFPEDSDW